MNRRVQLVLTAVFLAVLAVPGLIQAISELRHGEQPQVLDVFRQPPTAPNLHAYEDRVEKSSLVIETLRPRMQYAEWKILADAGEQVVLGQEGWLFYRPSVRYLVERPPAAVGSQNADPLPAIQSFRDQLAARGIHLLVVPVPGKESVYPEMLARRAEGAGVIVCEETRRLLDRMDRIGIEYVNLFDAFRHARQAEGPSNRSRLYLAQDTHWSPEGARRAAGAIARQVLAARRVNSGDQPYGERSVHLSRHGDLVQMRQVPMIERSLEPESLQLLQVIDPDSGAPYQDDPNSEILVLGDSFLRIYEHDDPGSAGLIAHLAPSFADRWHRSSTTAEPRHSSARRSCAALRYWSTSGS